MNSDPEKFLKNCIEDGSDIEIDGEFEQNIADLEAVLAASKSASNKRINSKKYANESHGNVEKINDFHLKAEK